MKHMKPTRPLCSGDSIGMIRPGLSEPFPEWPAVRERLEREGFTARMVGSTNLEDGSVKPTGPYYADDRRRALEIAAAFENPDNAAIMAFRGGSGTIRLLEEWQCPFRVPERIPLVCGFSDLTYLHAFLARTMNLVTFWGPNMRELSEPGSFDLWLKAVTGTLVEGASLPVGDARILQSGLATGILWGGNLESLAHLCGSPYLPEIPGGILLLEDIDEPLYAIDRALRTLSMSGVLRSVAGIVLGPFSRVGIRKDDPAGTVFDLLKPLIGPVPVIQTSLPGHDFPMATWPLNIPVELSCSGSGVPSLRLLESPFGSY